MSRQQTEFSRKVAGISISQHDSCGIIDCGLVVITAVAIVWA